MKRNIFPQEAINGPFTILKLSKLALGYLIQGLTHVSSSGLCYQ